MGSIILIKRTGGFIHGLTLPWVAQYWEWDKTSCDSSGAPHSTPSGQCPMTSFVTKIEKDLPLPLPLQLVLG